MRVRGEERQKEKDQGVLFGSGRKRQMSNREHFIFFYNGDHWHIAIDFCLFALCLTIILKSLSSSNSFFLFVSFILLGFEAIRTFSARNKKVPFHP